ncbi:MAG: FAD-dependent oxidoreductase [Paracoccaceae bacterium]
MVVGAGPAGLEAARAAAERGHKVEIVEALPVTGGQFRLAGQQPRRAQILDLLDWYERQFDKLGVTLRLNSFLDDDEIAAHPADTVVLATGSLPDETGFQRWLPHEASLPGLENGHVHSPEAVLRREVRPGSEVIVYDEGSNWRGVGTAGGWPNRATASPSSRRNPLSARKLPAPRPMVPPAGHWPPGARGS